MMKFNLNDNIYFKLTDQGQKRFADPYFAACVKYDQRRRLYACHMHAFCNLFGSNLVMSGCLDIETDIYFDIKELEEDSPSISDAWNDYMAAEYRPKCSWCNDCLECEHPFHDVKGEYCSVACMLTRQDHDKIAALEAWKADIKTAKLFQITECTDGRKILTIEVK